MKENVVLLGATGSIGGSSLSVIRQYKERFSLLGVSAFSNIKKITAIIDEWTPQYVCLPKENNDLIEHFPGVNFMWGEQGLRELAALTEADIVINAIPGMAGLAPTMEAIKAKKKLLSANKEAIVSAGDFVNKLLDQNKAIILPVDSEHNAIFNQLIRFQKSEVASIILTASGGPFRKRPIDESITIKDVLKHPTWEMGPYITVNSATMMNKGFEVIEAHHLFRMDYDKIKVLVHPQSQVHGMIETRDGSHFLCASASDMRIPISLCLHFPDFPPDSPFGSVKLAGHTWSFEEPDLEKFPLLKLAYEAGKEGGVLPAVLNAANEIVVEKFLDGIIPFMWIPTIIRQIVENYKNISNRW